MQISLVGIGMGSPLGQTLEAREAIAGADLLIGAKRLLDDIDSAAEKRCALAVTEIVELISQSQAQRVCVVCSGDTGFYSLATALREALRPRPVTTICGLTTVQVLAARLGRPWQDAALISAHGRDCNVLGEVLAHEETFFLTGGAITPASIIETLCEAGLPDAELAIGERLSYPEERVIQGTAKALRGQSFDSLSAVWVRCPLPSRYPYCTGGIDDEAFLRGSTPMTKQEVRAAVLAKLRVRPGETLYDVGAGTGSVSVELALASPYNRVYAIETELDAYGLICRNRLHFGAYNLTSVHGRAPEALAPLPAPDAVFIGGSKGALGEILDAVLEKSPAARIVVSAIAMETVAEAFSLCKKRLTNLQVTQLSVSRTQAVGGYQMLKAQNPIFLFSGEGAGR